MDWYTVDRAGSMKVGRTIQLFPVSPGSPGIPEKTAIPKLGISVALRTSLEALFPEGLTNHGMSYQQRSYEYNGGYVEVSQAVEAVAELIRRHEFPHRPSRLQCLFGCETLEGAKAFRAAHGAPTARIYKVECDTTICADMALLTLGPNPASTLELMRMYWRGEQCSTPVPEVLLKPPIQVIEQVDPPIPMENDMLIEVLKSVLASAKVPPKGIKVSVDLFREMRKAGLIEFKKVFVKGIFEYDEPLPYYGDIYVNCDPELADRGQQVELPPSARP